MAVMSGGESVGRGLSKPRHWATRFSLSKCGNESHSHIKNAAGGNTAHTARPFPEEGQCGEGDR